MHSDLYRESFLFLPFVAPSLICHRPCEPFAREGEERTHGGAGIGGGLRVDNVKRARKKERTERKGGRVGKGRRDEDIHLHERLFGNVSSLLSRAFIS